ncbi:transmembrane protein 42 isoform X3 [Zootoca vivipara]|uniref:transmembrane protein 42 isoform X3 n=1 Tax=Zootoca vivipara TaxID=8524 RepID=UPI0015905429|nr:transmembrane protein 42 isoform X3 [Zootoca vivipara]
MPAGWGAVFAAGAGLLGALAACSAKLALGADYLRGACAAVVGGEEAASGVCSWLPVMLRIGCGGLVLACNAIMWTFFAKALRYSSSSATATLTSTASNFISSELQVLTSQRSRKDFFLRMEQQPPGCY